ncbi:hypothetical protein DRQ33_00725 [bacterium]|nr:MAG: hypothetical protein DRQ33_00725 [bacterium]
MAKPKKKKQSDKKRAHIKRWHSEKHLSFDKKNYVLFFVGLICIIVGFILLSMESLTIAPLLIVLGYCVFIPLSILIGVSSEEDESERLRESGTRL